MRNILKALLCAALLSASSIPASAEAASTDLGRISIAQVLDLADRADAERGARMAIIAYLAALGESTGTLLHLAQARGLAPLNCDSPFSLNQAVALNALREAAPDRAEWSNTEATPIILADMLKRAGCQ